MKLEKRRGAQRLRFEYKNLVILQLNLSSFKTLSMQSLI